MKTLRVALLSSLLLCALMAFGQSARNELPSFAEPAISPDRSEIAFVSGGDIWTVPATGGEARLIVSHPASESRPLYSPDGKKLAFISTRTGNGDIYVLTLASGELKRLTFDDVNDQLDGWSRDGKWIYFSSASRDIAGMNDVFRVSAEGGTPMQVSGDRYASEYFSAPSPDGSTLAFTARGISSGQWWRRGHSHIDEAEIWLLRDGMKYEQFTSGGAKEMWPMWSGDGRSIFYVSDRSGAQNIWVKPTGGTARQVTKFRDGRVLWPNISADGKAIVFERNFGIWKLDTASGNATEVQITRRGAPAGPAVEHLTLTSNIQELALAPDGKKVAFVVRGEIFAASAKDGGDAARVSRSVAAEYHVTWSPDSKRLVYVSERDGTPHLFTYDFTSNTETQLTKDAAADAMPRFSPDGKLLAFMRGGKELRVLDLETKQERAVASGYLQRAPFFSDRPLIWSPDSKWIAYAAVSNKSFSNVYVVPAAGGESRQISALASRSGNAIAWSPDGTAIFFTTVQRTESGQVARIDLIPRTPKFREDQFRDLFRQETPRNVPNERRTNNPAPPAEQNNNSGGAQSEPKKPDNKPVEIVFEGIRQRLSLLPVGVDVNSLTLSPDGKTLLMTANAEGQVNLYTCSLDELSREPAVARQLTSTPGFKGDAQFSPDGKEIFFLEQGRISVVPVETRVARPLAVTAELDVDFNQEKMEVFRQAWTWQRDQFYDPNYHGTNWEAVRAEYEPRLAGARTPDEMRRLLNLMVGELNASHSGVSGPFTPGAQNSGVGKLGLRFDRAEYEDNGRLKITELIALGPAAVAGGIKTGDYLVAVDGVKISQQTNLDELLSFKVNRRVALTVSSSGDGSNPREVAVRPVSTATEKGLLYRQWVNERREYVARISNGRLGYVHMPDMSAGSLAQLYTDLDADNHAREGVVVDVRNNNGGFVNVYAIDVLARRGYLTMTTRGFPAAPGRSFLGQRALEAPTILVTNQHSLSDAEDFTEGYRALKLGKVVGEPTAGWIIYTSNQQLIDGSSIRLPFIKVQASDGQVMELNPRPVDVPVTRPIGESFTGRDSQLDAAVRELLKQI
ncbi:MAG TPA: LpqB family beta-propeller domain-containing protein, partial [Blastocatellia bacterium]|nr:LpqB family beta-propeller domain-containing protein [Blastocatellia bacterium]